MRLHRNQMQRMKVRNLPFGGVKDLSLVFYARSCGMASPASGGETARGPLFPVVSLILFCIEFWQEKPFRMHDRLQFSRDGGVWRSRLLYP
jgi:pyridoxine/pyridoxamine 5'-phosphate oxidase